MTLPWYRQVYIKRKTIVFAECIPQCCDILGGNLCCLATHVAHKMMMVIARRMVFIAPVAVSRINQRDQTDILKPLQCPIDGGDINCGLL